MAGECVGAAGVAAWGRWSGRRGTDRLWFTPAGGRQQLITRGVWGWRRGGAGDAHSGRASRGYLEGFATIYAEIARAIRARRMGLRLIRR